MQGCKIKTHIRNLDTVQGNFIQNFSWPCFWTRSVVTDRRRDEVPNDWVTTGPRFARFTNAQYRMIFTVSSVRWVHNVNRPTEPFIASWVSRFAVDQLHWFIHSVIPSFKHTIYEYHRWIVTVINLLPTAKNLTAKQFIQHKIFACKVFVIISIIFSYLSCILHG